MTKKRVMAIVGAGAAMDIAEGAKVYPSTSSITQEVIKVPTLIPSDRYKKGYYMSHMAASVYMSLKKVYDLPKRRGWNKPNFEELIYVLERLYTYSWYSRGDLCNKDLFDRQAPFIEVKGHLKNKLSSASHCVHDIVVRIMKIVEDYNNRFAGNPHNDWYRHFWKDVLYNWDIFTFNYDTTIEQSLGKYKDGFEPYKDKNFSLLNSEKFLRTTDEHVICHPHGCIQYGELHGDDNNEVVFQYQHRNFVKYKTPHEAIHRYECTSGSGNETQNGSSWVPSPIISGLDKLEKTDYLPMSIYRHYLYDRAVNNSSVFIVGYSFGDLYVNNILKRLYALHGDKVRICIVDYWRLDEYVLNDYERELKIGEVYSWVSLSNFMEQYLSHEMVGFLEYMAKANVVDTVAKQFDDCKLGQPLLTKNKRLMVCYNGFRDAAENHAMEIKEFLG